MASNFNPLTQNVTMHYADGTPFTIHMDDLDIFYQYGIRICINYSTQFGASIVLLIVLLLLTRAEKRSSAVFILNALALFFNCVRLICQVVYFTTPFLETYRYFTQDYSGIGAGPYAASILGVILLFFVLACVESSLVLQVQVVCSTLGSLYRRLLLGMSVLIALVPLGLRFAYVVEASRYIADAKPSIEIQWLESATNIAITISICFFCVVFVGKLGYAIKQRKRLGVREFGPMKVIFIMGCQTLVIPAIFSILQYAIIVPELSSNVLTLVAISLPLSSIWAGTALDRGRRTDSSSGHRLWNLLSFGGSDKSHTFSAGSSNGTTLNNCYSTSVAKQHPDPQVGNAICVEREVEIRSYAKDGDAAA